MTFYAFHAPTPDLFTVEHGQVLVRVKVASGINLESAYIRSEPDNEEHLSPLQLISKDDVWQIWQGVLKLDTAHDVTLYTFKFLTSQTQYWLSEVGITHYFPERDTHYRYNPHYKPASWLWSQIFYQIFPERFADGDAGNNVKDGEYLYEGKPVVAKAWNELPERKQGPREFYGGDLQGVKQRLDYVQDLGVTALYLNPIFTSPSSHKYDTVDYDSVDPHFGGNEAFADLCKALRERGIRLILDAVINHTSERHPWFDRYGEYEAGAYQSKESETRGFYIFQSDDPESYVGWYNVKTLPVLDFSNQELQGRIYQNKDSILRKWMQEPYKIDGWRFDVMHMLGEGHGAKNNHIYARAFKQALREENPQAYMLGEHFFEASRWLQGDQEDGAMNYYGFTRPLREFLSGKDFRDHPVLIDAQDLDAMLHRARVKIPFALQLSQFNLLGSHDVPRVFTVLHDIALLKIAITALFTYIGVPCVYYGDEVGLEGAGDPDCRRTFPWDKNLWNQDIHQHYKELIALRKGSSILQEGAFLSLYAVGDIYAYARVLNGEAIITILNRGHKTQIELPVWKLGAKGVMRLELAEKGATLLQMNDQYNISPVKQ
jgi:alpha-glucosidase